MKLGLFIIIVVVASLLAACSVGAAQPETAQAQLAVPAFQAQSNDERAVTVKVTPLNLPQGGSSLDFEVVFDTHSVDLGFDPVATSVLRDDAGREYPAIEWQGDGPGGHHRSGTLRFKVPDKASDSVEVVIRDVAGVPERVFRWNLTNPRHSTL
jgi:hypothetical protein